MARGRLISRTLGSSRRFAALQQQAGKLAEFAQALYPILVANADDYGRQAADAFTVKHAVFPSSPRKETDFLAALTAMHQSGLIQMYETDKGQVLQIVGFDEHQPGLSKRTASHFVEPPGNFTGVPGISLATELNRTELNRTEGKGTALRAVNGFEAFWTVYPRKKSRADAEKAWRKLAPSPELIQRIMGAVAAQQGSPDWQKDGGRFVPYGASWLNAKRWEDEPDMPQPRVERCQHTPPCSSPEWHAVVLARERGEV